MQDFKQGRGMHSSCLEQKSKSFVQSMENNDNLMKKKKILASREIQKGKEGRGRTEACRKPGPGRS